MNSVLENKVITITIKTKSWTRENKSLALNKTSLSIERNHHELVPSSSHVTTDP